MKVILVLALSVPAALLELLNVSVLLRPSARQCLRGTHLG